MTCRLAEPSQGRCTPARQGPARPAAGLLWGADIVPLCSLRTRCFDHLSIPRPLVIGSVFRIPISSPLYAHHSQLMSTPLMPTTACRIIWTSSASTLPCAFFSGHKHAEILVKAQSRETAFH